MLRAFLIAAPISMFLWVGIGYGVVTLKDMIGDSRYWPKQCQDNVCTLSGLGGIVYVWKKYIIDNSGALFVVKGTCASACEIALSLALARGEDVVIAPGARLIIHAPSNVILK